MTFIPQVRQRIRQVPKKIVVLGDCPDKHALQANRVLAGPNEGVFEQALHMAGLTKGEVAIVNLFPDTLSLAGLFIDSDKPSKRMLTEKGKEIAQQNLLVYVEEVKPKVIVALGKVAVLALLQRGDYTDIRGYPFPLNGVIVIPTLHPEDMIWSNYIWRFYLSNDLQRAKGFAEGSLEIIQPGLMAPRTADEALALLKMIADSGKPTAVDIEVSNYEVSCISFSNKVDYAFSIPIDERWSEEQELSIWCSIATVLESESIPKIFQNGAFDVYFLAYRNGIFCQGVIEDTMIAHSIMYPDFLKGLGFLGGSYTTYTYWKDQGGYKSIKKEN